MKDISLDISGARRGSRKSYTLGFILSVILTVVAFGAVMSGALNRPTVLACIAIAAIAQILVHLHYFLHLDSSSSARWNILAMVFAVLIMLLFVIGSLWIMYHLNYRMM